MSQDDLDKLIIAARQDRPADRVWPAAAAAIEVMWWHDAFADARALSEETINRLRESPGSLFDHDIPFDEAVLIGAAESGDDPATALARLAEVVPAHSVLGKRLAWLIQELPQQPPHSLVTGFDPDLYSPMPRQTAEGSGRRTRPA